MNSSGMPTNRSGNRPVDITVAICTYNRSRLLQQTLEAMTGLVTADIDWELLVVDNNCTDDTASVVDAFVGRLPVRRIVETEPGQCAARNAAIAVAAGQHIIWTDDDVLVDPAWLTAYARAFRDGPEIGVFGGPIEPWFEGDPPHWLVEALPVVYAAFAVQDLGRDVTDLTAPDRLPFGANMAFLTEAQRQVPYDTRIGLRPSSQMRGDESTAIARVLDKGWKGRWVPDARVQHFIPRSRQSIDYLRGYYRGYGEFMATVGAGAQESTLFRRPRWLWRRYAESGARYALSRLSGDASRKWREFREFHTYAGYLRVKRNDEVRAASTVQGA